MRGNDRSTDDDDTEHRGWRMKHPVIAGVAVLTIAVGLVTGIAIWKAAIAGIVVWVILRLGVMMLGGLARPIPEPPPEGELRKVKLHYRCEICGTEVRMTVAADGEPEAPRHCQDDMTLMTPVEDR